MFCGTYIAKKAVLGDREKRVHQSVGKRAEGGKHRAPSHMSSVIPAVGQTEKGGGTWGGNWYRKAHTNKFLDEKRNKKSLRAKNTSIILWKNCWGNPKPAAGRTKGKGSGRKKETSKEAFPLKRKRTNRPKKDVTLRKNRKRTELMTELSLGKKVEDK